jgi:hypothetical protein
MQERLVDIGMKVKESEKENKTAMDYANPTKFVQETPQPSAISSPPTLSFPLLPRHFPHPSIESN